MSASIYDQHQNAFSNVSAYVVMKGNERVATIAFKFPRDGASKLWVYVQWFGMPMVRGSATGYGYDKMSAACASASRAIEKLHKTNFLNKCETQQAFIDALAKDSGEHWDTQLRKSGFEVYQAV